jgi:hypothetical protein
MLLPFISHAAHVADWIRFVPAASFGQAPQPIRRPSRPLAQDDHPVGDPHIESIAGFDPEIAAGLARDDDLVLGADLHA